MSLTLEIDYLVGIAFAALGPESHAPDWPPQPDRVFSALVAAWAARGGEQAERRALEWLEGQQVPDVAASGMEPRPAPTSFVPPNDPQTGRVGDLTVMPMARRRQPRRFPAAIPHDPVVRLYWAAAEPDEATFAALAALARDMAYVGHSASLTRCSFTRAEPTSAWPPPQAARRRVYPGRLAELQAAFAAGRRPRSGDAVVTRSQPVRTFARSAFSARWLLLEYREDSGGTMPDIRAAALVARAIRAALLVGYQRTGFGARGPEVVSGQTPDGHLSDQPHLAIVPLAFAGFAHANGDVLGFALIPPRTESALFDDPAFLKAMRSVTVWDPESSRHRLSLCVDPTFAPMANGNSAARSMTVDLTLTLQSDRRSLDPAPYLGPATTFATTTPLVLDRHLRASGTQRSEELVSQIRGACRHIGLPEPELVVPGKHSAVEGAVSAGPSGAAPAWTGWRLPPWLRGRPLTHAVLRFAQPVEGPVLLGAGRYLGLGLCRAIGGWEQT